MNERLNRGGVCKDLKGCISVYVLEVFDCVFWM